MSEFSSPYIGSIIYKLKKSNDNDIPRIMNKYIKKALKFAKEENYNFKTIGCKSEINPVDYRLNEKNVYETFVEGLSFWVGYIPKDVKIVYSWCFGENLQVSNRGYYYYMNDKEYIYDFAKYIKEKKVKNDMEFLFYLYFYINNYFDTLYKVIDRDDLHKSILKNDKVYYETTSEHNITDFKKNGSAKCSEYAAMVQNILSTFGYNSIYLFGKLVEEEDHAFNIAIVDNKYHLLDFSYAAKCYDVNCNYIKKVPYIYELDGFDNNDLEDMLYTDRALDLCDLEFHMINDKYYSFSTTNNRLYKVRKMNFLS